MEARTSVQPKIHPYFHLTRLLNRIPSFQKYALFSESVVNLEQILILYKLQPILCYILYRNYKTFPYKMLLHFVRSKINAEHLQLYCALRWINCSLMVLFLHVKICIPQYRSQPSYARKALNTLWIALVLYKKWNFCITVRISVKDVLH